VPTDDGFGPDEDEGGAPGRPAAREPRPEEAVGERHARSAGRAREDRELLVECKVLRCDVELRSDDGAQEAQGEAKVVGQGAASLGW